MIEKFGYIPDVIQPDHWIFGDAQISADILQADGNWSAFVPPDEMQNHGYETYACASFGTLNCVETLLKRKFTDTDNYSDRFLASISGTAAQHGNSPHTVAEYLRNVGAPMEYTWPFIASVNTFDAFYAPIPQPVIDEAKDFTKHFVFQHDWVPTDPASLKNALQYSPLGISVYAWAQDADGLYYRPNGAQDCHWTMLYGYEDGICWHVFDSYDNTHKKLRWDFQPGQAKRYSIALAPVVQEQLSLFKLILLKIAAFFASMNPSQPSTPSQTPQNAPQTTQPAQPVQVPPTSKYAWDTPINARHSVRLICDEMGLTVDQKNLMSQVIHCESNYRTDIVHPNIVNGKTTSTDYGICQWNDFYHGKEITPDEAIHNPEKAVRLMCQYVLKGQIGQWVCYSKGMYKSYSA